MQERHLFEYAVIRVVPRVEREEFINVGVVLYCAKQKFLKSLFALNEERLKCLSPETEAEEIQKHLLSFKQICDGGEGGPISKLDAPGRFRWLTATRSTVVQASKVHPGLCDDPQTTLQTLFEKLVL